jgi:pSer/pThr/pTyr-binding forkhead associated (FHA) protein
MIAATNYAAVVRPLQLLIMVIAVLFFARVLRVAQVQSRPSEAKSSRRQRRRSAGLALAFLEPLDRVDERVDVDAPIVIGRSPDCDLPMNDTFLSSRHARFSVDGGDLSVEDLGSTNGTYVNAEQVQGRVQLERGDIVQVGGVLFEVVR